VTFPDGRKLFLGSTGTGAPDENQFPTGNKVTNPSEKPDKDKEKDKV
jgi:hypothetical protein